MERTGYNGKAYVNSTATREARCEMCSNKIVPRGAHLGAKTTPVRPTATQKLHSHQSSLSPEGASKWLRS
jgi:DNA-directed RNA polymerase subunit RPC12/RpoP